MKERFQKQEGDHERKMNSIRTKYETKIAEMQDRFGRDKRHREQKEKITLANIIQKPAGICGRICPWHIKVDRNLDVA